MKKILVANRGEIAMRVMKTAKRMGISTVAIFSSIDRDAPHVKFADEAIHIGGNPSNESYLLGDRIIEEAKKLKVDAIHPGYGFLSENAQFADAVIKNDMIFIGPDSASISMMGDKLAAKNAVKNYEIPMVPGIDKAINDKTDAHDLALKIGYPVLIKAAAGGGGKGMRVVNEAKNLNAQLERAISEALSAFGDGSVFIEKYISSPRHIEFQILADKYGKVLHLFERECSIQRRHQKVIEEAPSSILTAELRERMGDAAIKVAKSCNYTGAGTVEFLVDDALNYYFLEMNTRLQVEHPVTEYITGLDLVEQQINIARGEPLLLEQPDLKINGHALELRVYAEDVFHDFLPNVGQLKTYKIPHGNNIRVDDGYEQGMEIPIFYDPLISKLITHGKSRTEAIQKMIEAIDQYLIVGVNTTLPFGKFVCQHQGFQNGLFDTHFVQKYFNAGQLKASMKDEAEVAAILALKLYIEDQVLLRTPN